jgi:hypothetical protein
MQVNFTFQVFDDYCMSIKIKFKHHIAHTHTQNGLAELFIKKHQMITCLSRMKTKLIIYVWRHAILHVASFVHIIQQPIFFILVFFVVLYIFLLHPHNAIRWVLNVDLESLC